LVRRPTARGLKRTIAWLFGYRRLTIRDERYAHLLCAFLTLADVLRNLLQETRHLLQETRQDQLNQL
jgi:hypothetical protein